MRFIYYIALVFIGFVKPLFGQNLIYTPIVVNQCKGKKIDSIKFLLYDNDYQLLDSSSTSFNVKKNDSFSLIAEVKNSPSNYHLNTWIILEKSSTIDTFFTPLLNRGYIVSNPIEYFNKCGEPANGSVKDLSVNNIPRIKGQFKDGLPTDSIFQYYYDGKLMRLDIPNMDGRKNRSYQYLKSFRFFENGQIQFENHWNEKYIKNFYQSGQLKSYFNWSKRQYILKEEYYQNGKQSLIINRKHKKRYNESGSELEFTTRKIIIDFNIFTNRYYKYSTILFDSNGQKKYELFYNGINFGQFRSVIFPELLTDIDDYQFDKIYKYENGELKEKIEHNSTYLNNDFISTFNFYTIEGKKWIRKNTSNEFDFKKFLKSLLPYNHSM